MGQTCLLNRVRLVFWFGRDIVTPSSCSSYQTKESMFLFHIWILCNKRFCAFQGLRVLIQIKTHLGLGFHFFVFKHTQITKISVLEVLVTVAYSLINTPHLFLILAISLSFFFLNINFWVIVIDKIVAMILICIWLEA